MLGVQYKHSTQTNNIVNSQIILGLERFARWINLAACFIFCHNGTVSYVASAIKMRLCDKGGETIYVAKIFTEISG